MRDPDAFQTVIAFRVRREPRAARRLRAATWFALGTIALALSTPAFSQHANARPGRIEALNRAFLEHAGGLGSEYAIAVTTIQQGWEHTYRDGLAESFVPDALAILYPDYREALRAFDEDRPADVLRMLQPLRDHDDRFLAANADYFRVRALVELGQFEQAEAALADIGDRMEYYSAHTPYAPHLWFIKAFCESRNLRFEQARASLDALRSGFSDPSEAVQVGAAQLRLEIERREQGTLDEVATVMDYVADRLHVTDRTPRVQEHQEQIIAMLDKLIEQMQQKEQQGGGGGAAGRQRGGQSPQRPLGGGKTESDAPEGAGHVGELHGAPQAEPGEAWGKLPPAERERILQSIRERYPSRYRQLVEQYYRALGSEK